MSSLILIAHNARTQLIDSLARLTHEQTWDRIVVVDNGSEDGSSDLVRAQYPQVVVVQLGNKVDWMVAERAGRAFGGDDSAVVWLNEVRVNMVAEPRLELVAA